MRVLIAVVTTLWASSNEIISSAAIVFAFIYGTLERFLYSTKA